MNLIDLSNNTPDSVYTGRDRKIAQVILHDTAGKSDNNAASPETCQAALNATVRWFQGSGKVSIHYLIGPEKLGGKIYRLCREEFAAYHAVGNKGSFNGTSIANLESIGIERFGQPNEAVGPNQRAAMLQLVVDICKRYGLSSRQVISHMSIQPDRTDGNVLLAAAREAVENENFKIVGSGQPDKPDTALPVILKNGFKLGNGMLEYWNRLNIPGVQHPLGLPVSDEMPWRNQDGMKITIQVFERGVLGYDESIADPAYRVQGLLIGREWANLHLALA